MTTVTAPTPNLKLVRPPKGSGIYMTVTLAAQTADALRSADALSAAKAVAAQHGFSVRAQKPGSPNVYPVNEKGETTDAVMLGQEKLHEWHADFEFSSGI